jgi:hypothetical protein
LLNETTSQLGAVSNINDYVSLSLFSSDGKKRIINTKYNRDFKTHSVVAACAEVFNLLVIYVCKLVVTVGW